MIYGITYLGESIIVLVERQRILRKKSEGSSQLSVMQDFSWDFNLFGFVTAILLFVPRETSYIRVGGIQEVIHQTRREIGVGQYAKERSANSRVLLLSAKLVDVDRRQYLVLIVERRR